MVDLLKELSVRFPREKPPAYPHEFQAALRAIDVSIESLWHKRVPTPEIQRKKQEMIIKLVNKQIGEAARYQHVFRTQNGSVYFVFPTGESLRIKHSDNELKPQPLCEHIYYIDEIQLRELLELRAQGVLQEEIVGKQVRVVPCRVGVTPFEFGIQSFPPITVTENSDSITVLGDNEGVFASGYHLGHPVRELIK